MLLTEGNSFCAAGVLEIFPCLPPREALFAVFVEAIKEMVHAVTKNAATTNSVKGLVLYMAIPPFSPQRCCPIQFHGNAGKRIVNLSP
jgi:hypothetical protein